MANTQLTTYDQEKHPSADSAANLSFRDVIGNKSDTVAGTSLMAYLKYILAEALEIESHHHNYERWFEAAGTPSGETHIADAAGTGGGSFTIDAGNDTWGSWVQILGSSDTPAQTSMTYFDLHRVAFHHAERDEPYVVQIAFGASGAAALTAGTYTEAVFTPQSALLDSGPVEILGKRQAVGTKVWARCICAGQNTGTLSFFIGLHEYLT